MQLSLLCTAEDSIAQKKTGRRQQKKHGKRRARGNEKRMKLMQYAVIITIYGRGQYSTEKDGQEATKKE